MKKRMYTNILKNFYSTFKELLDVTNRNWEGLLYAPVYDFNVIPTLASYSRASVTGRIHSVNIHY